MCLRLRVFVRVFPIFYRLFECIPFCLFGTKSYVKTLEFSQTVYDISQLLASSPFSVHQRLFRKNIGI